MRLQMWCFELQSFRSARATVRLAVGVMLMTVVARVGVLALQKARSVSDGAYTYDQAARGESSYQKQCSYCHGADLRGDGFTPPLTGTELFMQRWKDGAVGDLFTVIKVTMPADRPASLTDAACADIVAYVLKMNGFPPGDHELSKKVNDLKEIRFPDRPGH